MRITAITPSGFPVVSVEAEDGAQAHDRIAQVLCESRREADYDFWMTHGHEVIVDDDPATRTSIERIGRGKRANDA